MNDASIVKNALPIAADDQAYCNVSVLDSGTFELPVKLFVANVSEEEIVEGPSMSFLIQHSKTKKNMLFDLGIRKDPENFNSPTVQFLVKTVFLSVSASQDARDSLIKGGLSTSDISYICISHCHFDHVGDTTLWPESQFLVGEEARSLLENP